MQLGLFLRLLKDVVVAVVIGAIEAEQLRFKGQAQESSNQFAKGMAERQACYLRTILITYINPCAISCHPILETHHQGAHTVSRGASR